MRIVIMKSRQEMIKKNEEMNTTNKLKEIVLLNSEMVQ